MTTLSNVVHVNVAIHNVDSTLFNVVHFNVEIHNIVSMLIWHCPTSRRRINQKTTLKQRSNVCWVSSLSLFLGLWIRNEKYAVYGNMEIRKSWKRSGYNIYYFMTYTYCNTRFFLCPTTPQYLTESIHQVDTTDTFDKYSGEMFSSHSGI